MKVTGSFLKTLVLFLLLLAPCLSDAHFISQQDLPAHEWKLINGQTISGYFLYSRGEKVFLQRKENGVVAVDLKMLAPADLKSVQERVSRINKMNGLKTVDAPARTLNWSLILAVVLTFAVIAIVITSGRKYVLPFALVIIIAAGYSFRSGVPPLLRSITSPATIDSAFAPFVPNVVTSWDTTYFYVECLGIPTTHSMMTGITSWQQQVPIPQCYTGTNHWSIPLNPVISSSPIPVDSIHFTRGAIALAVNGVPIFNPHTNTGVDALLDGQLDNWGGHSGRADDYHYHIAPLHLYAFTSPTLPIAYGLDGYAVYGSVEPDGTSMQSLDANHGHFWTNGVYHYHGTSTAPYMIGRMAGVVTEDTTHQLVPQPRAHPVRPSLTPLSGAVITAFAPTGPNGYILTYSLSGQSYQVDYNWTSAGVYTYNFISPTGTVTNTYNGFVPCHLTSPSSVAGVSKQNFEVYPVPSRDEFFITLSNDISSDGISTIELFSLSGQRVLSLKGYQNKINIAGMATGVYTLVIKTSSGEMQRKLIVN